MGVKVVDWLNASVVVVGSGLLATREEIQSFAVRTSQEVQWGRIQATDGTEVASIEVRKEQITVERSPERIIILKEYPDGCWGRLAEIAAFVLESSREQALTARGYNVSLVFDQQQRETAGEYIASEVFAALAVPGWELRGGQATLRFRDVSSRGAWTVKIEPRVGRNPSRVFMDLNLHLPGILDINEIRGYVEAARDGALSFLGVLK